jgi:hypothetical protein
MSWKTIAKISTFVILITALASIFSACNPIVSGSEKDSTESAFEPPQVTGHIANHDITEASGLVASKCQPNVFWTHNDSGDGPFIYAVNPSGENLGTWKVTNAENLDWEDIAERKEPDGICRIYIGEIGDNDIKRDVHTIYRVREPEVSDDSKNVRRKNAPDTDAAESVNFSYADMNQNAETLLVHPTTGDIYVLTKRKEGPSGVYKIAPTFGSSEVQKVTRLADLQVPSIPVGLLTGGDISPDGRSIALCDYIDGYELTLPADDTNFDDIWKQQPMKIDLGEREQGEAICYSIDGRSIFATTEKKNAPIIEVRRK